MEWNRALDRVLKDWSVSAKWLSAEAGVSEVMISQFRKGKKDATTKTLAALLAPLPFEAQASFHSLVLGGNLPPATMPTLEEQIEKLDKESQKQLSYFLIDQIAKHPEKKAEVVEELATV